MTSRGMIDQSRRRYGSHAAARHSSLSSMPRSSTLIRGTRRRLLDQWRNYGWQWRQPPHGASPEGAPRDQCQFFFLTLFKLHEIWSVDS